MRHHAATIAPLGAARGQRAVAARTGATPHQPSRRTRRRVRAETTKDDRDRHGMINITTRRFILQYCAAAAVDAPVQLVPLPVQCCIFDPISSTVQLPGYLRENGQIVGALLMGTIGNI